MPRPPAKKSTRSRASSKSRRKPSNPYARILTWLTKRRGFALGLVSLAAIPFLLPSFLERLPTPVQDAWEIPALIRDWVDKALDGVKHWKIDLPDIVSGLPSEAAPSIPAQLPHTPGSFTAAKKALYEQVYYDHRVTFYCGCEYNTKKEVALSTCGLQSLSKISRAKRIEAEHVFPAAQFGNFRKCWREPKAFPECTTSSGRILSGRDCCQRVDPVFEAAHNDLHNLYPEDGYINGQRSDFNWGMVSGGERFGDCEIRIDESIRRVQPPARVRGDIARTMLYMRDTYGFRLSRQDEQLYRAWNNDDPPDAWEIERDRRIKRIEGVGNRYVEEYGRL